MVEISLFAAPLHGVNRRDEMLAVLQRFHVATTKQLQVLVPKGRQTSDERLTRRWVDELVARGAARKGPGLSAGVGRGPNVVVYGKQNPAALQHHLQVTEFAVQLRLACWARGDTECEFRDTNFGNIEPDLCFVLSRPPKHLLFFLEIDRGTEPVARGSAGSDVQSKLDRYVQLRVSGKYSEAVPELPCRGFRVLLVANSERRFQTLCRLAQTPPGDFVWVSSGERLVTRGIGESVWWRNEGSGDLDTIFSRASINK